MDSGLILVATLFAALLGCLAGVGTGLVPGVHVNNVALVVTALAPAILPALAGTFGSDGILVLAGFLAAASVAHGIASLLPSVFLGAPDADTALSVLPGHRMLVQGKGHEAVLLGARGALLGVGLAIPLVLPFRLLLGDPVHAYDRLRPFLPFLLLLLVSLLIATEGSQDSREARRRRTWAVLLLLLSGALGWIVLRPGFLRDAWALLPMGGDSLVLFPLFTGLFGLPTLVLSMGSRGRLPPQDIGPPGPLPTWRSTRGLFSGAVAGAAVSWFPGLGGTNATVVAQLLAGGELREDDPDADREFLFAASAASAATNVFTFATLFVILRARSGVATAVDGLADGVSAWSPARDVPVLFAAILFALAVSAVAAYLIVTRIARPFAVRAGRVRYGRVAQRVGLALIVAVVLVTGPVGGLVLATSTALGICPPLVGVRRVHLMGCLLVPILVSALA